MTCEHNLHVHVGSKEDINGISANPYMYMYSLG